MKIETETSIDWFESAVTSTELLFSEAAEIRFTPRIKCNEHYFGDVIIHTFTGEKINLTNPLIEVGQARMTNGDTDFLSGKICKPSHKVVLYDMN